MTSSGGGAGLDIKLNHGEAPPAYLLNVRFPIVGSLRTDEDTYATLICQAGSSDSASAPDHRPVVELASGLGKGDDREDTTELENDEGDDDASERDKTPTEGGNDLKSREQAAVEPIVEESRRRQVLSSSSNKTLNHGPVTIGVANNQTTTTAASAIAKTSATIGLENTKELSDSVGVEKGAATTPDDRRGLARPNNGPANATTASAPQPQTGYKKVPASGNPRITMSAASASSASPSSSAGANSPTSTTTTTTAPLLLSSSSPKVSQSIHKAADRHVTYGGGGGKTSGDINTGLGSILRRRSQQTSPPSSASSSSLSPANRTKKHDTKLNNAAYSSSSSSSNRSGGGLGTASDNQLGLFILAFVSSLLIIVLIFAIVIDNLLSTSSY